MNWRDRLLPISSSLPTALLSVLLIATVIVLTFASVTGRALFDFVDETQGKLAADEDIRVWASFDRDSYLVGDLARYRIQVSWRDDRVTPDLQSFETSIGFFPFDHRAQQTDRRRLGGGVREYVAVHTLQPVNVDAPASYRLDTVTVYYTRAGEADVHAVRANAPQIHIGEFYPANISAIPLLPPKSAIDDAHTLRRTLMAVCAVALTAIALVFLWVRGRKRPYAELSAAEKLWRDFDALRTGAASTIERAGRYETLFTEVLELRTGVTPIEFWSGEGAVAGEHDDAIVEAHRLFAESYRADGPTEADTARMVDIIGELLLPMVEEERLERETHDDFIIRLRRQPRILAASGILLFAALAALMLAAMPSVWLPEDLKRYNEAVALIDSGDELQQAVDAFAAVSEIAEDPRIRSASLYNLGTLLADPRLSRLSRDQHRNFLLAIFLPETEISLGRLLHDMELDAEFELITMLTELTRQYVQAEQSLKSAVRAGPWDPDMGRNLEILGKVRRAIGRSLARLVAIGDEPAGTQQMLGQTVIDLKLLMESELPDEFAKTDEGKDDRNYFILERF